MRVLGDSVRIRYLNLVGQQTDFPEDYYQGEYIIDIARKLKDKFGNMLIDESPEGKFKEAAESEIFNDIKKSLLNIDIHHKIFFNEKSLYDDGKIANLLQKFDELNLSYEKDGATWLKLSLLTGSEDKVIVKNRRANLSSS